MSLVKAIGVAVLVTGLLGSSGCSTYRTMEAMDDHTPKVFSGTRLDIHALRGQTVEMRRFKTEAAPYPLVDLPASLVVDAVILPVTLGIATYEWVFEQP